MRFVINRTGSTPMARSDFRHVRIANVLFFLLKQINKRSRLSSVERFGQTFSSLPFDTQADQQPMYWRQDDLLCCYAL